tara:strand:- start:1458 stop:1928 length:471 start_codon:yes stop_codon:yes gene_type:complete
LKTPVASPLPRLKTKKVPDRKKAAADKVQAVMVVNKAAADRNSLVVLKSPDSPPSWVVVVVPVANPGCPPLLSPKAIKATPANPVVVAKANLVKKAKKETVKPEPKELPMPRDKKGAPSINPPKCKSATKEPNSPKPISPKPTLPVSWKASPAKIA